MQNYCKQGRHHSFGRGGGEANLTVSVVIYIKLFLGEQLTMSGVIQHFSRHINKFNCDITRNFKPFSKVLYRHRVAHKTFAKIHLFISTIILHGVSDGKVTVCNHLVIS